MIQRGALIIIALIATGAAGFVGAKDPNSGILVVFVFLVAIALIGAAIPDGWL